MVYRSSNARFFFEWLQNVDILQNNQDNTELTGDEDLDESEDNKDDDSEDNKDDDSDDENSTSKWNSMASRNIRALVIYIFNEKTGILETATQLVNTKNAKNFGKNVEKAKQILDGKLTCNICHLCSMLMFQKFVLIDIYIDISIVFVSFIFDLILT